MALREYLIDCIFEELARYRIFTSGIGVVLKHTVADHMALFLRIYPGDVDLFVSLFALGHVDAHRALAAVSRQSTTREDTDRLTETGRLQDLLVMIGEHRGASGENSKDRLEMHAPVL